MPALQQVVLIAAENGALPGRKATPVGELIRDLAPALTKLQSAVTIITPSYGTLHTHNKSSQQATFNVPFADGEETIDLHRIDLPANATNGNIRHWVLDSPTLAQTDDSPEAQATRFALFGAAVANVLTHDPSQMPNTVHLHGWQSASVLLLRHLDPRYKALKNVHCVYSLHNLEEQACRPITDHESSVATWFPSIAWDADELTTPGNPEEYNPVAMAVRTADTVHAPSPNYAAEIQQPANPERAFYGGRGLESVFNAAAAEERLVGVTNGCYYPTALDKQPAGSITNWSSFLDAAESVLMCAAAEQDILRSSHFVASNRIQALRQRQPSRLLTTVCELTPQTAGLLLQDGTLGHTALEGMLSALGNDGLYILLGAGDAEMENTMTRFMAKHPNFLFINCNSRTLAEALYAHGDLYVVPSSDEPCGQGHMFAMRAGQPCLVHAVGGLVDTVQHGKNGFCFAGDTLIEQSDKLVIGTRALLQMHRQQQQEWRQIKATAVRIRFSWPDTARKYLNQLYRLPVPES